MATHEQFEQFTFLLKVQACLMHMARLVDPRYM